MNNTKRLAIQCGFQDDMETVGFMSCDYAQLEAFRKAIEADFVSRLIPMARIDMGKRKVILDDTVVFKTPTIAVLDDMQLYALPKGETK